MNIDEAYWKQYYNSWDEFVSNWFNNGANPTDAVTEEYKRCVKGLDLNELPEPYLGTPHKRVKAVFINLNPGGSCGELEATKFYSNRNDEQKGWLIREFINVNKSYRSFVDNWSALNDLREHQPEVCGVRWWQDLVPNPIGGRMNWVRQIYGDDRLSPSEVFAPEVCPYHSKTTAKFHVYKRSNTQKDLFLKNLIVPVVTATSENKLPFAIAIGAPIRDIIEKHIGVKPEKEWSCGVDRQRQLSDEILSNIWPCADDRRLIVRWYKLYRICVEGKTARILVTWTVSPSNPPPRCGKDGFFNVEQSIRQYVDANPIH